MSGTASLEFDWSFFQEKLQYQIGSSHTFLDAVAVF